jgi:3-hydroxyisobutyrate dehydrogenase-like beta-hydroxyacid dehydrogenase
MTFQTKQTSYTYTQGFSTHAGRGKRVRTSHSQSTHVYIYICVYAASSVVITMLPATAHVAGVLRGADGVFELGTEGPS